MKIATWNVNSIRSRLAHVVEWLENQPVDVLCVQETKVVDADFPKADLEAIGYTAYISGQKSYNGVALLSREPLESVSMGFTSVLGSPLAETIADLDEQKRVITGVLGNVRIVNLYVPNGSAVGSEKYEYKLRWLATLRDYLKSLLLEDQGLVVCGDFNIAPDDRDIYKPEGKENHIMASPAERQALQTTVLDLGLVDAFRQLHPEAGQFTWWDYRTAAFRRDAGWRIDHHYISPQLGDRLVDCVIDKVPRGWEKPSDHTPVILELG
ncbi:exodeoxyribonuclease III [Egbenema bharatensis]|uniref:exodeoxyribonuclease III n=1 Tax=Egbenema bharatensis TaxID=3463334 RepID=UPI003A894172